MLRVQSRSKCYINWLERPGDEIPWVVRVFRNHGEKCDMVIRWSSRKVVAVCSDLLNLS